MTVTDPSDWPGFSNQAVCIRDRFTGTDHPDRLLTWNGCGNWPCVCNSYDEAVPTLASFVSQCERDVYTLTSDTGDVAAATSLFSAFCSQLPGVTRAPGPLSTSSSTTSTSSITTSTISSTSTSTSASSSPLTSTTHSSIPIIPSTTSLASPISVGSTTTTVIPTSTAPEHSSKVPVGLGVGLGIGLPFILLLAILCWWRRQDPPPRYGNSIGLGAYPVEQGGDSYHDEGMPQEFHELTKAQESR